MFNTVINIPQNVRTIVWTKNGKFKNNLNIYLYNTTKKYKLFINCSKNELRLDRNTNSILIYNNKIDFLKKKKINNFFSFLKSWDIFFFSKIKFKGKGFRMRFFKKNKFVKFFFGKSHKTFILFKKLIMRRINKYKFILKSIKNNKIKINSNYAVNIRPLNLYTLRGIRTTRQIVFKRKGKKGTYI